MLLLKLLRKIGKIIRGGASSKEVFLGTLIGLVWGMIPGFNLSQLLMLVLFLLFNANFGFMLTGFLFGSLFCYGLSSLTFELGYVIIENLGGLLTSLNNAPILAFMDVDSYCLIGGIPIGIILGSAFGAIFAKLLIGVRAKIDGLSESERAQALQEKAWMKTFMFIAFGGNILKLENEEKKDRLFRPMGLGLIIASVLIFVALELVLLDSLVKKGLESELSQVNGAEVSIDNLAISLSKGSLEISGVQFADSADLNKNLFEADKLIVDFSSFFSLPYSFF